MSCYRGSGRPTPQDAGDGRTSTAGACRLARAPDGSVASIPYTPRAPCPYQLRCRRTGRRAGPLEVDALVPAVHSADGVRLDRESQVLVHADIAPPDALAVGVVAGEGARAVDLSHPVGARFARDRHERRRVARTARLFLQAPASQVMRHAEHAGTDAFRSPTLASRNNDPRPQLHEIAGPDPVLPRVHRRDPQGVRVRISYSHFTAERVCTSVGSRKFGRRSNSPSSRFSSRQCTCPGT